MGRVGKVTIFHALTQKRVCSLSAEQVGSWSLLCESGNVSTSTQLQEGTGELRLHPQSLSSGCISL